MAKKASPAKIISARREYETVKRLYKRIGKTTQFGRKAKVGSQALSDYVATRREYRRAGNALAKLTRKKPRR